VAGVPRAFRVSQQQTIRFFWKVHYIMKKSLTSLRKRPLPSRIEQGNLMNIDKARNRFRPNNVQRIIHSLVRSKHLTQSKRIPTIPTGALSLHDLRKLMPRWYPIHVFGGHQKPIWLQDVVSFNKTRSSKFQFLPTGEWEVYDTGSRYQRANDWRDLNEMVKATSNRRYGLPKYKITMPHFGLSKSVQRPGQFIYCQGMARYANDPGWQPLQLQVCDGNYMSTNCLNSYVTLATNHRNSSANVLRVRT
jgi:hypothetical protein